MSTNTRIWDQVNTTDPSATKNFTGMGGFKGTAIKPTYLMRKATGRGGGVPGRQGHRERREHAPSVFPARAAGLQMVGGEITHHHLLPPRAAWSIT
ncbi:hypothetical protein [Pseudomonas sp. S2_C03]